MTNDPSSHATYEAAAHLTAPYPASPCDAAGTMDQDTVWRAQLAEMQQRMCTSIPALGAMPFAHGSGRGFPPVFPATEAAEEHDPAGTLRCDPRLEACISTQHADWLVEAIAARQDRPRLQGVPQQVWTASPVLGGTRLQCWDALDGTPRPLPGDRCAAGRPLLTVTVLGSEARLDQGLVLGLDRRATPAILSLHPRQ